MAVVGCVVASGYMVFGAFGLDRPCTSNCVKVRARLVWLRSLVDSTSATTSEVIGSIFGSDVYLLSYVHALFSFRFVARAIKNDV